MNQEERAGRIICVGQSVQDIYVGSVWHKSFAHETIRAQYVKHLPGGHAVNDALCLRKFGKEVAIVGRVGADAFGMDIVNHLKKQGVDVSGMMIDPLLATSVSIIIVDLDGENTILQNQTGNNAFPFESISLRPLEGASIVCVGSLWSLPGLDGDGVGKLFDCAHAAGALTVADTGEDSKYIGIKPIITALRHTDYFVPSQKEAITITGHNDVEKAAGALLEMGPRGVIIRMGAEGCLAATKDEMHRIPTLQFKPVDTTGAGDNFIAGFLAKLSEGSDIFASCVFANAAGALSTLSVGANSAAYDYATVQARAASIPLPPTSGKDV